MSTLQEKVHAQELAAGDPLCVRHLIGASELEMLLQHYDKTKDLVPPPSGSPAFEWVERGSWIEVFGRDCNVTLEERPPYCDRGRFIAKVTVTNPANLHVDAADCWPRYYFDLCRAKQEIEAWLTQREQTQAN